MRDTIELSQMNLLILLAISFATLAYARKKPWILASTRQKQPKKSSSRGPRRASSKGAPEAKRHLIRAKMLIDSLLNFYLLKIIVT